MKGWLVIRPFEHHPNAGGGVHPSRFTSLDAPSPPVLADQRSAIYLGIEPVETEQISSTTNIPVA